MSCVISKPNRKRSPLLEAAGHYLWLLPAILLVVFFLVIPTFQTIYLSLHEEVKFSESQFTQELLNALQAESAQAGGGELTKNDSVEGIPGWQKAIGKIQAKYGIQVAPGDINEEMTVKDTAEMLILTINQAQQKQGATQRFAGLKNYFTMFTDSAMLTAFRNNLVWLVLFTIFTVVLGLAIAVLAERVRWGALAKTVIFLPMAISGAASAVIWNFMYQKDVHTGTINALIHLFNRNYQGIAFLGNESLVNFALIAAGIWMQVGFCTVIFGAALKSVPAELIEMAHLEGATSPEVFFKIEIPYIQSTIVLVITQMCMWVLKVFDIIFALTHGGPVNNASEVIANRIYITDFNLYNFNYGSAMAVILFLAVIPVLIMNTRNLAREESIRE